MNKSADLRFYDKKYFEGHDLLSLYLAKSLKIIMRKNNLKTVLDVGCATGRLVKFFNDNNFQAYGCDIADVAVRGAREINKNGVIFKASATKLPFKKNSLDFITAISIIEHLTPKEAEKFIKETMRVLKPGGLIFLITPNFATPLRLIHRQNWFAYKDPTHVNFYTPWSLARFLNKFGFGNFKFTFKAFYHPAFDEEFPTCFAILPKKIKIFLIFFLISSPLTFIRNSFWLLAKKND